ncbi:hypothetical protein TBLA_0G00570 [Henningerozyma blattae CBS 6284]|uniref:Chitin biosynthesis protein CHS5 n=1 Tax=Henningerozyma blattae (strain ATCC 34711 / CBS 6284 / DSM 70876 / NBRC 10599 / NRRL Y-10934 / UCD 77-7) TaxID=1071380 RepID=I2H6K4_HENB6|nr:hypothetical protein TBLA_0G00570 [Tetrapisispora blattae CBS 6284]CCH62006.1 hypothetical protein TBLA_0G00570 [Tetrapisispora blattae CBS 6284]
MSQIDVVMTVGKLDASLALLTTQDHHVIEFPTMLLPETVKAGSIVKMTVAQDTEEENKQRTSFKLLQNVILEKYGTEKPKNPLLKIINITQTSCVLQWDTISLGSARFKSLILYKQGIRAMVIPNPFKVTSTKISGLSVDKPYDFQLKLSTTSGDFWSEKVKVHTHKMTDMSGITVCLGPLDPLKKITRNQIATSLRKIGAKQLQDHVSIDTTHFITNDGDDNDNQELIRAKHSNIPIVSPQWIRACEVEKKIIGVRGFYLDADKSILKGYAFPEDTKASISEDQFNNSKSLEKPEEDANAEAEVDNNTSDGLTNESSNVNTTTEPKEKEDDEIGEPKGSSEAPIEILEKKEDDSQLEKDNEKVNTPVDAPIDSIVEDTPSTDNDRGTFEKDSPDSEALDNVEILDAVDGSVENIDPINEELSSEKKKLEEENVLQEQDEKEKEDENDEFGEPVQAPIDTKDSLEDVPVDNEINQNQSLSENPAESSNEVPIEKVVESEEPTESPIEAAQVKTNETSDSQTETQLNETISEPVEINEPSESQTETQLNETIGEPVEINEPSEPQTEATISESIEEQINPTEQQTDVTIGTLADSKIEEPSETKDENDSNLSETPIQKHLEQLKNEDDLINIIEDEESKAGTPDEIIEPKDSIISRKEDELENPLHSHNQVAKSSTSLALEESPAVSTIQEDEGTIEENDMPADMSSLPTEQDISPDLDESIKVEDVSEDVSEDAVQDGTDEGSDDADAGENESLESSNPTATTKTQTNNKKNKNKKKKKGKKRK